MFGCGKEKEAPFAEGDVVVFTGEWWKENIFSQEMMVVSVEKSNNPDLIQSRKNKPNSLWVVGVHFNNKTSYYSGDLLEKI